MMYGAVFQSRNNPYTFEVTPDIEVCKAMAEKHARENPRIPGSYLITEMFQISGGGYSPMLNPNAVKGIKHGKSVEWNK